MESRKTEEQSIYSWSEGNSDRPTCTWITVAGHVCYIRTCSRAPTRALVRLFAEGAGMVGPHAHLTFGTCPHSEHGRSVRTSRSSNGKILYHPNPLPDRLHCGMVDHHDIRHNGYQVSITGR